MIKKIIKLDGTEEDFMPSKLNHWGEWAAKSLGEYVDWPTIVLAAVSDLPEVVSSQKLQEELISKCLDKKTWSYYLMAGKLYVPLMRKKIFNSATPPTIFQVQQNLREDGLMVYLNYSLEEYAQLEQVINHDLDFESPHHALYHIRFKYSLRNQITGKEYETPQFVYMRMAMALSESEPVESRMNHVIKYYSHFSEKRLSAPTPNYVNLGTSLKGFASCCLFTSDDTGQSLATGDYIANMMTQKSAGIGNNLMTRSVGDPVRNGIIKHQGKLPYYASMGKSIRANLQNGRGGAGTTYYSAFDPEAMDIAQLSNPRSVEDKRNRDLHYALMNNAWFAYKISENEDIFVFNIKTAPDLTKAFYSGNIEDFISLYEKYEQDSSFVKKYVSARSLLLTSFSEAFETGVAYLAQMDEINRHTPFIEPIYCSNLCVAPETKVLTDQGYFDIKSLSGSKVNVWNGQQWSSVDVVKTGENQELFKVELTNGKFLECTHYHKWYIQTSSNVSKEVRTHELKQGDCLIDFMLPGESDTQVYYVASVIKTGRFDDTYCFTEPLRGMGIFNGILTGQCTEITQPTIPYQSAEDLFIKEDHGRGEISTCNLAAVIAYNIRSDEEYADVMFYALDMVDKTTEMAEYAFPHLAFTALQRRNAGIGIMGMATLMAQAGVKISEPSGKHFTHRTAERHMWHAINASLKISKKRGNAPWMHKTKWPQGWLPIDTYNKNTDSIADFKNRYDWESLRQEIIANGGIAHSALVAYMPGESSSKAIDGCPNSIYLVRNIELTKSDGALKIQWSAFESDRPGMDYERAYETSSKDMIEYYAIWQKWTDQAISADMYRRLEASEEVEEDEIINDYLYLVHMGMKTRYYFNTQTADGAALDSVVRAVDSDDNDKDFSSEGYTENNDSSRGCSGGTCTL